MEIKFHGVRGSAPAPGAKFARYGGDTPCVEIAAGGRRLFVDAGSGLKNVDIAADTDLEIDIVLSHYHFDHLIGLPFFAPVWRPGGALRIWAPRQKGVDPKAAVDRFFSPPYCPVALSRTPRRVEVRAYAPGDSWRIGAIDVDTLALDHPGGSSGFRISDAAGASVVYASDVEIADPRAAASLVDFVKGAGLVVIDAMLIEEERAIRRGWGHSVWTDGAAIGIAAEAARIALFHHDPDRDDEALDALDKLARKLRGGVGFARQGDIVRLGGAGCGDRKEDVAEWRCSS